MPELHPDLAPLAAFLGSWAGQGHGEYPTIPPFDYGEELTFSHVGKPFLVHVERTKARDDGRPLHTETGYWRVVGRDDQGRHRVELVVAQPTGVVEVLEGVLEETSVRLRSVSVARTSTAKEVKAVEREYRLENGTMQVRLAMAAVGHELTHHLSASLARVS